MPDASHQPTIKPSILALHLTYRCPLQCAHCCIDAGPKRRVELCIEDIDRLIENAALNCQFEGIGITGGDPFLLPELVLACLTQAKRFDLRTHIVTSAYWAKSKLEASRCLAAPRQAGLDELCISYDDAHAEYVSFNRILFAYEAAMAAGIPIRFLISTEPASIITKDWLKAKLEGNEAYNAALTSIDCGSLQTTGRSADTSSALSKEARKSSSEKYLGPCPIIFRRLAVNPDGNILACCGTVPFHKELCIGDIAHDTLYGAVEKMYTNNLLKWIAFEGPVHILKLITENDRRPLVDDDFDGICHACDILFSDPILKRRAYLASYSQKSRLDLEELIFRSMGHFPAFVHATTTQIPN